MQLVENNNNKITGACKSRVRIVLSTKRSKPTDYQSSMGIGRGELGRYAYNQHLIYSIVITVIELRQIHRGIWT